MVHVNKEVFKLNIQACSQMLIEAHSLEDILKGNGP